MLTAGCPHTDLRGAAGPTAPASSQGQQPEPEQAAGAQPSSRSPSPPHTAPLLPAQTPQAPLCPNPSLLPSAASPPLPRMPGRAR